MTKTATTQSTTNKIRNFSIIAHIDHGKTTLTDAFLQLTQTVTPQQFRERMLDSNPIEQERGVTIKLAPVRMQYQGYTLNLIDTPGHVDFGYEVSRSLAACEGAVLLIDATQGIQAQTLANWHKAQALGLTIIPVLNKIDLASAEIEQTLLETMETFNVSEDEIILASAKTQENVDKILQAVINQVPPPKTTPKAALQALIITSVFDAHKGAIAYVRVMQGALKNQSLYLLATQTKFSPKEIGVFAPNMKPVKELRAGEVGYLATGLKDIKFLKIGDTITSNQARNQVTALPGFKNPQPMVFMELYPIDNHDFAALKDAMAKLKLNDAALKYRATHSPALGNGLRVGFLGIFHAEVIRERLEREFNLELIATAPAVTYQVITKQNSKLVINHPNEMPDPSEIAEIQEPIAKTMIFSPSEYLDKVIKFCRQKRGRLLNTTNLGNRIKLDYQLPLAELITDFHDQLKSLSSGFASLEYELSGYKPVDAVKVDILINKELIPALSFMAVRAEAETKGRTLVKRLKKVVPRQLFEIPLQAAIGGKIIARETLRAYRKDVTAKLYGGDRTRRMKLLQKQSKGKKKMKQVGKVELN
ncbi:MAG: elongation factor 4, partial [Candidatus Pacebacteria bacterium]|nr:elongation factor 4 [Candidatus Paceibacterota bacterium]